MTKLDRLYWPTKDALSSTIAHWPTYIFSSLLLYQTLAHIEINWNAPTMWQEKCESRIRDRVFRLRTCELSNKKTKVIKYQLNINPLGFTLSLEPWIRTILRPYIDGRNGTMAPLILDVPPPLITDSIKNISNKKLRNINLCFTA